MDPLFGFQKGGIKNEMKPSLVFWDLCLKINTVWLVDVCVTVVVKGKRM